MGRGRARNAARPFASFSSSSSSFSSSSSSFSSSSSSSSSVSSSSLLYSFRCLLGLEPFAKHGNRRCRHAGCGVRPRPRPRVDTRYSEEVQTCRPATHWYVDHVYRVLHRPIHCIAETQDISTEDVAEQLRRADLLFKEGTSGSHLRNAPPSRSIYDPSRMPLSRLNV